MGVAVATYGQPGVPGDPEDDRGDGETDERVGDRAPDGDHGRRGDDGQRDVGIGACVGAVGHERRAAGTSTGPGADQGGDPVPREPDGAGGRERAEAG